MSRADAKPTVIALHCSGGAASEWARLEQDLGESFTVIAPDLTGCDAGSRTGERAFTLSDEAAPIVKMIDAAKGPVHLVGHSYGGCVALRLACRRPSRIASLSLYEPAVLHVLRKAGRNGEIALAGFKTVARDVGRHALAGALYAAAKRLVECWNGRGGWSALPREVRDDLAPDIPEACFAFSEQLRDRPPLPVYARFGFPVLLLQGEYSSEPMQRIARQLGRAMTRASRRMVYGAGHMGPFTHPAVVSGLITEHIVAAASAARANVGAVTDYITAAA